MDGATPFGFSLHGDFKPVDTSCGSDLFVGDSFPLATGVLMQNFLLKFEALSLTVNSIPRVTRWIADRFWISLWMAPMVPQLQAVRRQPIEIPEIHCPWYLDFC